MLDYETLNVLGHNLDTEFRSMRRSSVVPQVDCKDLKIRSEEFAHGVPIVEHAEQAVEDHEREPCSVCLIMQLHSEVLLVEATDDCPAVQGKKGSVSDAPETKVPAMVVHRGHE